MNETETSKNTVSGGEMKGLEIQLSQGKVALVDNEDYEKLPKRRRTMKNPRIFLASPYTHKDKEIMTFRYEAALLAASRLVKEGNIVFSPIIYSHPMAITYNLPKDYSFWQAQSNSYIIYWATAFSVLCLQDWDHSVGIKDELALAQSIKLPVFYMCLG